MRRTIGLVLTILAVGCCSVVPAQAAWTSSATGSATAQSATLAPPPTLTATCVTLSSKIKLDWTASTTSWKDGYEVSQGTSSGNYTTFIPTTSLTYTTPPAVAATYYFTVRTTSGLWRSAGAAEVFRVVVAVCL